MTLLKPTIVSFITILYNSHNRVFERLWWVAFSLLTER
jgi:hypothetical protein